ncbi:hypothetical protein ABK040_007806 [Willaertia magna]
MSKLPSIFTPTGHGKKTSNGSVNNSLLPAIDNPITPMSRTSEMNRDSVFSVRSLYSEEDFEDEVGSISSQSTGKSPSLYNNHNNLFALTEINGNNATSPTMMRKRMKKTEKKKKSVGWNVNEIEITENNPLPFNLKYNSLVDNLLKNIRFPDENSKRVFDKYFCPNNPLNQIILKDTFWFVFCTFFKPKDQPAGLRFVKELSVNTAKYFLSIKREDKDTFLDVYHFALSYCILKALKKHFSASKKLFTLNFQVRVYELICELFNGVKYKRESLIMKRIKYFPLKSEESYFEKLKRKQKKKKNSKKKRSESLDDRVDRESVDISRATTSTSKTESYLEKDFYSSSEDEEDNSREFESVFYSQKQEPLSSVIQKLGIDENYHCLPVSFLDQEVESPKKKIIQEEVALEVNNINKKKLLSPRITSSSYNEYFYSEEKLKEKYWDTFTMSPLVNKALEKEPTEFAAKKVRLLHKDGTSNSLFRTCTEEDNIKNISKYNEIWNPLSATEIKKSKLRQRAQHEQAIKNIKETRKDIKRIRQTAKEEKRILENERRDILNSKTKVSDLCKQIISEQGKNIKIERMFQSECLKFKGEYIASTLKEKSFVIEQKLAKVEKIILEAREVEISKEEHQMAEQEMEIDYDKRDPPNGLNVSLFVR